MSEVVRKGAVRIGVDLAKRVIQVHAVDFGERVLTSRALARDKFLAWCARLPAGCNRISTWVLALHERFGWQKAVVALANKNARILWVVMTRGAPFDADHLSTKPDAATASAAAGMAPTVPA